LELDARSHECRIQLSLQPDERQVMIDRVQIEQVVVNLVSNAIDSMSEVPTTERQVNIVSRFDDTKAEVAVSDRGVGISVVDFRQLFEPFFTTKPAGMGMGLAICRSIIEAHGGKLWASANPDVGMTFQFTLPLPNQSDSKEVRQGNERF
jgi:two-component system sensor kinase FixL